jgi:hypothetical protein
MLRGANTNENWRAAKVTKAPHISPQTTGRNSPFSSEMSADADRLLVAPRTLEPDHQYIS